MADIKGALFPLDYKSGTLYKGIPGDYKFYPTPPCPPVPAVHYRMRAWNLTTVDWEVWTSTVTPNVTPPSGNPVIGVTVVGIWEA